MDVQQLLKKESEAVRDYLSKLFSHFPEDTPISVLEVKKGVTVIAQNTPCTQVYILVRGIVKAAVNQPGFITYPFSQFSPVEFFGEQEILGQFPHYIADVRTQTPCRFFIISADSYREWIRRDNQALLERVRSAIRALLSQAAQERDTLFMDSLTRLLQFLDTYASEHKDKNGTLVAVTRGAISEETGCSIRTVNRAVIKLKEQGLLGINKGKIHITGEQGQKIRLLLKSRLEM